ncbi:hypothetical protein AB0H18_36710, partial [Streptomyces sp. NPDC020766]|uniref:hypothetical protein n=1 Tax=Streptomyces sp. NPDC020766 TaxID=3155011 RepID=UPI0033CC8863
MITPDNSRRPATAPDATGTSRPFAPSRRSLLRAMAAGPGRSGGPTSAPWSATPRAGGPPP